MAIQGAEQAFKALVGEIADHLSPYGFSKRANALRCIVSGNAMVVEFQRSQSSSSGLIRFTLNVGIISGRLLDGDRFHDVSKVGAMDAHLRARIGEFLAEPTDRWWELDAATNLADLVADLIPLLDEAVRFLRDHVDDGALVQLWESGRSPGLTEFQRQRFLRELKVA